METNDTNKQTTKAKELYEQGWHYHNRREYGRAAKCYKEAAALGYTLALYYLALLYYEGKGVEKDLVEAAKCFETVANESGKRSEEARLRLERLADIDSGKGIGIIGTDLDNWIVVGAGFGPGDVEEYRKMWKLAEQGDLEAQKYVASTIYLHISENGCPDGDGETMLRYLRNLAEHGDAWAQSKLAETFINDNIVGVGIGDLDDEEGIEWYRKAAQGGNTEAQYLLADFLYRGDHVEKDREEAFFWQIHFIENESYISMHAYETIGYPYTYGDGEWYTTKEAFKLFKKFAEQGDAIAQKNLAYFYLDGEFVRKNRTEAFKWFTKAAEQGNEEAQFKLGALYYEGEEVEQNYEEALKWYRKSAEQGRAQSQYMMGEFYSNGIGVTRDDQEAVEWYKKAAKHAEKKTTYELGRLPQEVMRACKRLGLFYHEGRGVTQSDEVAARWYEKAGRLLMSMPDAAGDFCDLAESYFYGDGIHQDVKEALKWYKRAAQKNHPYAQRWLAEYYEEGKLLKQDYKEAYKWYSKLAKSGDIDALFKTGLFYLEGKSVKENRGEAIARIKKAAFLGNMEAKQKLLELGE